MHAHRAPERPDLPRTGSNAAARQDLGRAKWSVASCELCEPSTEADLKPVTESNLTLRAPGRKDPLCVAV